MTLLPAVIERFSKVEAIYFDLDDTLCGYWNASKKGLRESFESHPVEGFETQEMVETWGNVFQKFSSGLKNNDDLYQTYLTSGEVTRTMQMAETLKAVERADDDHAQRLSQSYMERRDFNLRLFEDAIEVLESLSANFPLGLITNGPADIQNQEIDTLGIRKYFQNIFIEGEMRVGKPHEVVFERAAQAVSKTPEQLLMVGNSFGHDILPAIQYGWATAWTRRDSDVPPSSKTGEPDPVPTTGPLPDLIIDRLSDLLPYLVR